MSYRCLWQSTCAGHRASKKDSSSALRPAVSELRESQNETLPNFKGERNAVMLQAYVLLHAGLLLGYWAPKPWLCAFALIVLHVCVFGGTQHPTIADPLEFAVMRVFALCVGTGLARLTAALILKPKFQFHSGSFTLKCLCALLLYTGTLVAWQIAPQRFWNYIFVVSLSQLFILTYSFFCIEHYESWGAPHLSQFVTHYHYGFMWLTTSVVFCTGQIARPDLPTYFWTLTVAGIGLLWIVVHVNTLLRGQEPTKVTARAIVAVTGADGEFVDPRWRVSGGRENTPRPVVMN